MYIGGVNPFFGTKTNVHMFHAKLIGLWNCVIPVNCLLQTLPVLNLDPEISLFFFGL